MRLMALAFIMPDFPTRLLATHFSCKMSMDDSDATSLGQLRGAIAGSGQARFAGQRRDEVSGWVEKTLMG